MKLVTFTTRTGEQLPAAVVGVAHAAMRLVNLVVLVDDPRATVWKRHVSYSDAPAPNTWRDAR